jgi:hypothetical protein
MSPDLLDKTWMSCGISLLWDAGALNEICAPESVRSLREFVRLHQADWPEDALKLINNRVLVVAGLEAAMDTLNPLQAVDWLEQNIYPAVRDFQDNVADGGGEAALIFWFADANRIWHRAADNTHHWHCSGEHQRQSIPIGRCIWNGAESSVRKVVTVSSDKKAKTHRAIFAKIFMSVEPKIGTSTNNDSKAGSLVNFKPGERVRHTDLGEGVVIATPLEGFVKVFFPSGERQLPVAGLTSALSRSEVAVANAKGDPKRALRSWLCYQAHALPLMDNVSSLTSAKIDLLPHQVVLTHRVATASPRRFLIADEVGLGKTIETALILRELVSRGELKRALMVVPAGLVNNWHRELNDVFHLNFEVFGSEGDVTDRKSNAFEKHNRDRCCGYRRRSDKQCADPVTGGTAANQRIACQISSTARDESRKTYRCAWCPMASKSARANCHLRYLSWQRGNAGRGN